MTFSNNYTNEINAALLIELVEKLSTEVLKAPKSDKRDRIMDVLKLSKIVAEAQLKSTATIEYLIKDRDRQELFKEMHERNASYYEMLLKKELEKYDN